MNQDDIEAIERVAAGVQEYVDGQVTQLVASLENHEQRIQMVEQWIRELHAMPDYRDFIVAEAKRLGVKVTEILTKEKEKEKVDESTDDE